MKTTHLRTRREGETRGGGGEERCLSRKVEILDDGGIRKKKRENERERMRAKLTLIMRVPHERGAKKSTSNPLTEGD